MWHSGLRIQHCHCSGLGRCYGVDSIPDPGTSTCRGCGQKINKFLKIIKFILHSVLEIKETDILPVSKNLTIEFVHVIKQTFGEFLVFVKKRYIASLSSKNKRSSTSQRLTVNCSAAL